MLSSFKRVLNHGVMLADRVRMESYRRAISETIRAGDVVCDIGTGSGILAFFALQAGAEKVYAIEKNEIIEEAKELAELNGLGKRIIFIKKRSDKSQLPEKVDVITSELIGYFGLEENLNGFQIDARDRFLKPDGRLLPHWLELYLAPVQFNKFWDDKIGIWSKNFYGLDFSPVKKTAAEQRYITDCSNKLIFLAEPALIGQLDFYKIKTVPSFYSANFSINDSGNLHGLVGYFKVGLSERVILSTAAEEPLTHWQQSFFPFEEPFLVKKDDRVYCKIRAIPQGCNVFWQWDTDIFREGSKIVGFSQTNFTIDKEELIIGRSDFTPVLTPDAAMHRYILNLCDGGKTLEEIAEMTYREYSGNLNDIKETMKEIIGVIRGKVKF